MKRIGLFGLVFVLIIFFADRSVSQPPGQQIVYTSTTPSGSCSNTQIRLKTPDGLFYTCQNGTWGAGGGTGPTGPTGPTGATGATGATGSAAAQAQFVTLSVCTAGTCSNDVYNGRYPITVSQAASPQACVITANTAPSGSGLTFDLKKNGSTSITSSPMALTSGNNSATITSFAAVTVTRGDYLTFTFTGTTGQDVMISCMFQ